MYHFQLLSEATDEMSNHVGQTIAGILNATFGNVVELIVAVCEQSDITQGIELMYDLTDHCYSQM